MTLEVLQAQATAENRDLREWAIAVLDQHSPSSRFF